MMILTCCIGHAFGRNVCSPILEFWGLSELEDIPWLYVPGTQERYDWCFAQAFKRSKDFTAILEPETILLRSERIHVCMPTCQSR